MGKLRRIQITLSLVRPLIKWRHNMERTYVFSPFEFVVRERMTHSSVGEYTYQDISVDVLWFSLKISRRLRGWKF